MDRKAIDDEASEKNRESGTIGKLCKLQRPLHPFPLPLPRRRCPQELERFCRGQRVLNPTKFTKIMNTILFDHNLSRSSSGSRHFRGYALIAARLCLCTLALFSLF